MDVRHDVRPCQIQHIRIAGHLPLVIGEPCAPIVRGLEVACLDHRPPGAVEHDDPFSHQRL